MPERSLPPSRADHVGSLLRPASLLAARAGREAGNISAEALRRVENEAIGEAVRKQEELGLKVVTDGELRRAWYHLDFLQGFTNIATQRASVPAKFQTAGGELELQPVSTRVVGKLTRPRGIFIDDFKFLKSMTTVTPKMTIPSPSAMHFRGGRKTVDVMAYPEIEEFYDDLARVFAEEVRDLGAAGCRYLQLDEVSLAYLCDPTLQEQVRKAGEDPTELPKTYAALINGTLAQKHPDMVVCMHLCRGNYRSGWVAEGGYEPIAEMLFNEIAMDGYFLEYDSDRAGNFEPLRFVPKGKIVVLGLITSKSPQLESKDDIKRRIDQAAKFLPLDQLALSPQCGFASTAEGNALTAEEQYAKLRLTVEIAKDVWG